MGNMKDKLFAKMLNASITRNKFEDKDLDNYIYASLSQPPIKILDKRNSDDELDFIVECPNCHSAVNYGEDIFMYAGHIYCSNNGCREEVVNRYESKKLGDDKSAISNKKEDRRRISKANHIKRNKH